jgi:hypothetical protein
MRTKSFSVRLAALEALEAAQANEAGELFEAACWGGLPEDHWFLVDGVEVSAEEWGERAARADTWIVLMNDAPIPPAPRPLRVYWLC